MEIWSKTHWIWNLIAKNWWRYDQKLTEFEISLPSQ